MRFVPEPAMGRWAGDEREVGEVGLVLVETAIEDRIRNAEELVFPLLSPLSLRPEFRKPLDATSQNSQHSAMQITPTTGCV